MPAPTLRTSSSRFTVINLLACERPEVGRPLAGRSRRYTQSATIPNEQPLVAFIPQGWLVDPRPLDDLKEYLDFVSRQWDETLSRLKTFVET